MEIPLDENHRFLNWQNTEKDCQSWINNLTRVPHTIAVSVSKGGKKPQWTIFKHMIISIRGKEAYCCDEGKRIFRETEVAKLKTCLSSKSNSL